MFEHRCHTDVPIRHRWPIWKRSIKVHFILIQNFIGLVMMKHVNKKMNVCLMAHQHGLSTVIVIFSGGIKKKQVPELSFRAHW